MFVRNSGLSGVGDTMAFTPHCFSQDAHHPWRSRHHVGRNRFFAVFLVFAVSVVRPYFIADCCCRLAKAALETECAEFPARMNRAAFMPSAGITTFHTDYLFCRSNQQATRVAMEDMHMRQSLYGILIGAAAVVATSSIAFAGEQKLEFKLVTFRIDPTVLEAANIDGQTITASKAFGVAYFKDGRVAVKNYIFSTEILKGSGPYAAIARTRSMMALRLRQASPERSRRA
jgi:hypothetical protein